MLSGSTYVQINFGNLTLINGIQLTVPGTFAPIQTIQLGYSWDGTSFAMDTTKYNVNGGSSYAVPLSQSIMIRYLRVYLINVVQPSDLLTKTSGFSLNVTGAINSSNVLVTGKKQKHDPCWKTNMFLVLKMFVQQFRMCFHHERSLWHLHHKLD